MRGYETGWDKETPTTRLLDRVSRRAMVGVGFILDLKSEQWMKKGEEVAMKKVKSETKEKKKLKAGGSTGR